MYSLHFLPDTMWVIRLLVSGVRVGCLVIVWMVVSVSGLDWRHDKWKKIDGLVG